MLQDAKERSECRQRLLQALKGWEVAEFALDPEEFGRLESFVTLNRDPEILKIMQTNWYGLRHSQPAATLLWAVPSPWNRGLGKRSLHRLLLATVRGTRGARDLSALEKRVKKLILNDLKRDLC